MSLEPELWRVGHSAAPLGFAPVELYEFSHRFDDAIEDRHVDLLLRLTDPAPEALRKVTAPWRLELEPTVADAPARETRLEA